MLLQMFISFLKDENILSDYPELNFAIEIDTAFINSDFRSTSDSMSEHSTILTSTLYISSVKVVTKICSQW